MGNNNPAMPNLIVASNPVPRTFFPINLQRIYGIKLNITE
jgi:hypothetical protein